MHKPAAPTWFTLLLFFLLPGFLLVSARGDRVPETKVPLALETFDEVWRIVYEHHFDTNFNGLNWLRMKDKFRPRAAAAPSLEDLREVLQQMVDLLEVSHMAIVPGDVADVIENSNKRKKSNQIEHVDIDDSGHAGFDFRLHGKEVLVTHVNHNTSAAQAGIQAGWKLEKIGKTGIADLIKKLPKNLDQRKRNFLAWRALSGRIHGTPGTPVELKFRDGKDRRVHLTIERDVPPGEPVEFGNLPVLFANFTTDSLNPNPETSIGLIRFNIWLLPTALAFNKAIDQHRAKDGLIVDLRGNVGGLVGMLIGSAGHFFHESGSLGRMVMRDNNLTLLINPRLVDSAGLRVEPFSGPVAILVDEITASASEVFAGGMQDLGRAQIFGRTTAGQALPAIFDQLPNGDAFYHPVADFIPPKGKRFEGKGVTPDVEISLDRKALLQGRDLDMEKAIEWITKEKSTPRATGSHAAQVP